MLLPFVFNNAHVISTFLLHGSYNTELNLNAIREELRAAFLMMIQHQYVLDLMTTMEREVCAKISAFCFTFIHENDRDNGTLALAIQTLHCLETDLKEEGVPLSRTGFIVYSPASPYG